MNERAFNALHKNAVLQHFLRCEARRHFGRDEDLQEDAISEAWVRILAQPAGQTFDDYKRHGARAIHAMYQRMRYRRQHLREASIDDGGAGKPSSALAQLAEIAVRGDW
jgi:hypothetical protein